MSASIYAIDGNTAGTSGEITPFDTITIAVSAGGDELNVIPTPALTLNNGATATYFSGAGTDELLFVYTPSSGDDIATLGVTAQSGLIIDDTSGGSYLTVAATVFPNVNVDTTPPSLTLTGTSADALQGGAPVTAASSATITDSNGDGTLNGATISIANRQPGDTLGIAAALRQASPGPTPPTPAFSRSAALARLRLTKPCSRRSPTRIAALTTPRAATQSAPWI